MDMLQSPFKKHDEFEFFKKTLTNLHNRDAVFLNNIVGSLSDDQKKFLKEHIQTKRIKIEHKGVETEVARRFV